MGRTHRTVGRIVTGQGIFIHRTIDDQRELRKTRRVAVDLMSISMRQRLTLTGNEYFSHTSVHVAGSTPSCTALDECCVAGGGGL
jgi:hypothetical protein